MIRPSKAPHRFGATCKEGEWLREQGCRRLRNGEAVVEIRNCDHKLRATLCSFGGIEVCEFALAPHARAFPDVILPIATSRALYGSSTNCPFPRLVGQQDPGPSFVVGGRRNLTGTQLDDRAIQPWGGPQNSALQSV